MRAENDVTYLAFKIRVTAADGVVTEGAGVAIEGRIDAGRVRQTIIDLVRTAAGRREMASREAS